MKTIVKTTAFLMLFGSLLISCNKSKEENTDLNTVQDTENERLNNSVSNIPDTSGGSQTENDGKHNSAGNSPTTTSENAKTNKRGEKMSAPDGTDKENHDGDMYTKNDTTRMPSGTTIK